MGRMGGAFLTVFIAIALAAPASAAVQPLGTSAEAESFSSIGTVSLPNFTAAAGSDRLLVVSLGLLGGKSATSVKFGDTSLTRAALLINEASNCGGCFVTSEIWTLALGDSVAATTATITATYPGDMVGFMGAQVFSGAAQSNSTTSATSEAASVSIAGLEGDYVVDSVTEMMPTTDIGALTAGPGQIELANLHSTSYGVAGGASYRPGADGNTALTWSGTSNGPTWAHVAVNINQVYDADGDGVEDGVDNCAAVENGGQTNTDGDTAGDACDADDDNDTVADGSDNCALVANADQTNSDNGGTGDACDADDDNDTVADAADNCRVVANQDQLNTDGDAEGDACDADDDNDTVADASDAFPLDKTRSAAPVTPVTPVQPVTPALTAVQLKSTRFSRRTGTKLSFTLNTPSAVVIESKGKRSGRRKGGRCSTSARRGRRCTIRLKTVKLTTAGAAGLTTIDFGRGLKAGKYTARLVAVGATGLTSLPVTLRFTIR